MTTGTKISNAVFRFFVAASLVTAIMAFLKCLQTFSAALESTSAENTDQFISQLSNMDLSGCVFMTRIVFILLIITTILSLAAFQAGKVSSVVTRTIFLLIAAGIAYFSSFVFYCAELIRRNFAGDLTVEELQKLQKIVNTFTTNGQTEEEIAALLNIMGTFLITVVIVNLIVLTITSIVSVVKSLHKADSDL